MTKKLDHLLLKHGVLTSLSVARKLSDEDIVKMTDRIKSIAKNKTDFNNKLKDAIEKETAGLILEGKIPGVIVNNDKVAVDIIDDQVTTNTPLPQKSPIPNRAVYNVSKDKLAILYAIAAEFNKETLNNKLTKNDICFIIYTILTFLEIRQDDFKKFHNDLNNPDGQNE
jgi:hypothetical protein